MKFEIMLTPTHVMDRRGGWSKGWTRIRSVLTNVSPTRRNESYSLLNSKMHAADIKTGSACGPLMVPEWEK